MLKILNKKTILILGTVTLSVTITLAQSYGCKGGCLGVGSGYNVLGGSANVKFIQGIIGAKQDGYFGAETRAKLAAWQKANGVLSDGVLGDQTIAKMKEKMTGTPEGQQQLGELMQSSFPQGSEKMIQNIEDLTNGIKPNPELPPNTVNIPPSDTPSTSPPPPDSNIWSVDEMKRLANTIGEQTNQLRTDQSLTPEQRQELIAARNDAIDELDRQIRRKADYQDEDIPENKELQDLKKVEGPDPEQPQPEPYRAANERVPEQKPEEYCGENCGFDRDGVVKDLENNSANKDSEGNGLSDNEPIAPKGFSDYVKDMAEKVNEEFQKAKEMLFGKDEAQKPEEYCGENCGFDRDGVVKDLESNSNNELAKDAKGLANEISNKANELEEMFKGNTPVTDELSKGGSLGTQKPIESIEDAQQRLDKLNTDCPGGCTQAKQDLQNEIDQNKLPTAAETMADKFSGGGQNAKPENGLQAGESKPYACTTKDGQKWENNKGSAVRVNSLVKGGGGGVMAAPLGTPVPGMGQKEVQKDTIVPSTTIKEVASECEIKNGKLVPKQNAQRYLINFEQTGQTNWK